MAVSWVGSKFWQLQHWRNIGFKVCVNADSRAWNSAGISSGSGFHSEQMNKSVAASDGEPAQKSFVEASLENCASNSIMFFGVAVGMGQKLRPNPSNDCIPAGASEGLAVKLWKAMLWCLENYSYVGIDPNCCTAFADAEQALSTVKPKVVITELFMFLTTWFNCCVIFFSFALMIDHAFLMRW